MSESGHPAELPATAAQSRLYRWWQGEWRDTRQKFAFLSLVFGAYLVLAGTFVMLANIIVPVGGLRFPAALGVSLLGGCITYGGYRLCGWGYRTITARMLTELSVVSLVCGIGCGIVAWTEGAPVRDILGFASAFLVAAIALFVISRLKSDSEVP